MTSAEGCGVERCNGTVLQASNRTLLSRSKKRLRLRQKSYACALQNNFPEKSAIVLHLILNLQFDSSVRFYISRTESSTENFFRRRLFWNIILLKEKEIIYRGHTEIVTASFSLLFMLFVFYYDYYWILELSRSLFFIFKFIVTVLSSLMSF